MNTPPAKTKAHLVCELAGNTPVNRELFQLEFAWPGPAPRAGQFFMLKPRRSGMFLARPISAASWSSVRSGSRALRFLIARRGRGTGELAALRPGEEAELTGPLGNAWLDFLSPLLADKAPAGKERPARIALAGGGIGIAPLMALLSGETPGLSFDVYAGFRTGFTGPDERNLLLGPALQYAEKLVIATEDGSEGLRGRIPGFLDPAPYTAVCACGPEPMLQAVSALCKTAGVPCFVSLERRMACGVGACLGCTVRTLAGNRRCCADGPIFRSEEVFP
ncbi:MAG: dihydroorotate dehydrogenase electron transfer subunit [Treponema sp.]|jgi:NAD(P)H-flavin reductase|nr:dihydroorotate dehydrogenase electron transfer subunit [Treponema sp.]